MLNNLFNSGGCYNLSLIVRGSQIDSPFFSPLTAIIRLPLSRQKHCAAIFFSLSLSSIPRGVVVRLRRPSICFLSVCPSSRTFFRIISRHSWFIFDHFTSFVMYFRPFLHHIFLLHCLHCLSTILPQIIIPFSLIYFRSDYINCVRETIQVI